MGAAMNLLLANLGTSLASLTATPLGSVDPPPFGQQGRINDAFRQCQRHQCGYGTAMLGYGRISGSLARVR